MKDNSLQKTNVLIYQAAVFEENEHEIWALPPEDWVCIGVLPVIVKR